VKRFSGEVQGTSLICHPAAERYQRYQVLWRGYLANRDEILREAERRRTPLSGSSEGEFFALAYHWWGDAMQSRLIGEYSVAIFDGSTASLFLTHDALGLAPMFYCHKSGSVLFSSHLEDLVLTTGGSDLDEEYIADYVADCTYSSERTPYRAIQRLGFGCSLTYRSDRIAVRRTWDLSEAQALTGKGRDYEDRFLTILSEGVTSALRAQGPVWSELSGGLDSSTVACMAARSGAGTLDAISLVYSRYARADESKWMRLVLDQHPMPWHRLDGDDLLPYSEVPDRFLAEPGLPMIDWSWRRRYEELASEHGVAAVLTGQGGDFVLFGNGTQPYYLADLARTLKPCHLFSELSRWRKADRQKRSLLYWLVNYVFGPLVSYARRRPLRAIWRPTTSPWIHPEYAGNMALDERGRRNASSDHRSVERYWFMERLSTLCGRIANLNQMPQTFEFRHPLLYRPLIEFMLSLPAHQKFDPEMDRSLQRRALKAILPEPLRLRRDKTIFDQPCYEGLRTGKVWSRLLTDSPRVVDRGIVDPVLWTQAVEQAKLGHTHFLPQFEAVATLEIWLRQFENLKAGAPAGPGAASRSGTSQAREFRQEPMAWKA
jgi:asparagine synthase (glutamine-hydrolysing)